MRIEADLRDNEPRTVTGIRGIKARPFVRRFTNAAEMDRWLDGAGDVRIDSVERA